MRWNEFAVGLGEALAALPHESILVVPERGADGNFVQFRKSAGGLLAEMSLPAPTPKRGRLRRLVAPPSQQQQSRALEWADCWERLAAAGWSAPLPKQSNWWREVVPSASHSEYADLAEEVTRVLTDELRIGEPTDLEYVCWQDHPYREPELDSLPLRRISVRDWMARLR